MRIPVFARGSNPAIDHRLVSKSLAYGTAEVEAGRADWVDPNDHSRGILCREFLYSGQQLITAAPETVSKLARPRPCPIPPLEVGNARFDDPEKTYTKRKERMQLIVSARAIAYFDVPLDPVQQI